MFKRDKLNGITGADSLIILADGAASAGAPHGHTVREQAERLVIHEEWRQRGGLPAYQQTVMTVIMAAVEQARGDRQVMTEIAGYGAMLMGRVTEVALHEESA